MSLTWHIAKKDLRRMALPVGAWLAFLIGAAVWFGAMHMDEDAVRAGEHYRWINGVGGFTWWITAMQVVTGGLLAAHLILEDRVTGTTAFWQTRPIAGGRMLMAKLISGGLMFVLVPAVLMTPVWMAQGFSFGEVADAAGEFMAWQAGLTVLAFGFAALSRNLAQFSFAVVGAVVVLALGEVVIQALWRDMATSNSDAMRAWMWLMLVAPVMFTARVMVHQFVTRQTRRGWLTVAVGGVMLIILRATIPDQLMQWCPPPRSQMEASVARGERFANDVTVKRVVTPINRDLPPTLFLAVSGPVKGAEFLAPESTLGAEVRFPDRRRVTMSMQSGGLWGDAAARRVAGLVRDEGPVEWGMAMRLGVPVDLPTMSEASAAGGMMKFARMNGRVLTEVPLRAGSLGRSGASELRLVGFGALGNRFESTIVVEESDSVFVRDVGLTAGRGERAMDQSRRDVYLLVNRALGITKCLHIVELGSANMASMLVSTRRLEFTAPTQGEGSQRTEVPGWRDGAVLIKVRFELAGRVLRNFRTDHVPLVVEEEVR